LHLPPQRRARGQARPAPKRLATAARAPKCEHRPLRLTAIQAPPLRTRRPTSEVAPAQLQRSSPTRAVIAQATPAQSGTADAARASSAATPETVSHPASQARTATERLPPR